MYNIWQDAGIRTRVAATATRCATNELHTSLITVVLVFISTTNNYAKKVFNGELKLKEAFLALKKTLPYSTLFDRVKLLKGFNFFIINLKYFRLIKLNF